MAYNIKLILVLTIIVVLSSCSSTNSTVTAARPLLSSSSTLAARLKVDDDESSLNCWDSLSELQACTGEILLFFLNGETYLGHGCCEAIHMIGNQCWPDLIDMLGFTSEEGDILEGYCDASDHDNSIATPSNTEAALIARTLVP